MNKVHIIITVMLLVLFTGGLFEIQPVEAADFSVNSTDDDPDANAGNGICETSTPGECTLRAAIQEANVLALADTIRFDPAMLPATITLTNGELALSSDISIQGPGTAQLTVSGNDASRIFNISSGTVSISGITIANGFTNGFGGGIFNDSTLSITNITVSDSTTTIGYGGGIYNNENSTMAITNSTISGNSVNSGGGGIFNNGTMTITNSTVSSNFANLGFGAAIANGGPLTITYSTIAGNSATANFGGIYSEDTTSLTNTIIAYNTNTDCLHNGTGTFTTSMNIIEDGSCGGMAVDPLLGSLQDNGGPTFTHALLPGSPAIDAAGACPPALNGIDQRGFNRIDACDLGAYELIKPVFVFAQPASTVIEGNTATPEVQMQLAVQTVDRGGGPVTENVPVDGIFTVTVGYTNLPPTSGADYTADTSVSFDCTVAGGCTTDQLSGIQTDNLSILAANDAVLEVDETVDLTLLSAVTGIIGAADLHTLTITNTASVSIVAADGAEPAINGLFTVNMNATNATGAPITVTYAVAPTSTATSSVDYAALTGTVDIPDGAASVTINLAVLDDLLLEGDESVTLTLTGTNHASVTVDPGGATALIRDNEVPPTATPVAASSDAGGQLPSLAVFDPAISKIGFLVPGQVGVTGEQLEWIITVTNNGSTTGTNLEVRDTLDSRLSINRVATSAGITALVADQTVVVTIPSLAPGQTTTFSIFTTVLEGVSVENTACVTAAQLSTPRCVTGLAVMQLPATGESPWWRLPLLISLLLTAGLLLLRFISPLHRKSRQIY